MANDLRIPVSVGDGFTGPLAKLRNEMQKVSNASGIKTLNADWKRVEGSVVNVTKEVASLTPMFNGLGLASMGLGAGIAAAAIGVRNFALGARDMSMFSKETGVAVERLRVLEAVGRRYGVSADQVRSNAQGAADNFDQIRRRIGGLYQDLRSRGEFNLAESLVGSKNVNEYMDKVFDAATRMSNPKRRQEFLKNALGSDDFSKVIDALGPRWRQFFSEVQERIGNMPAGAEAAAAKFNEAMEKMNDAMEKLRVNSMGPLLEASAKLIEAWEKPVGGALLTFMKDMQSGLDNLNAAGKAWKDGDYFAALRALNGGQPIFKDLSAPLPGTETKGVTARMDRLGAATQQLEKLNNALDSGKISPGARDNVIAQRDRLQDEIKRLTDELVKLREQGATVQQQSFNGGGFGGGGLIQNASFGGFGGGMGGPVGSAKGWYDFKRGQQKVMADANGAGFGGASPVDTGGSGDGGTYKASRVKGLSDSGRSRVASWMNFLMRPHDQGGMGFTREQAAGVVAGMQGESGINLNPAAHNPNDRGAPAIGTAQWRDRAAPLQRFAAARGKHWSDMETQQQFMRHEFGTTEARALRAIRGAKSAPEAVAAFVKGYERPQFAQAEIAKRVPYAGNILAGGDFDGGTAKRSGDALTSTYVREREKDFANLWERRYSPGDEMMQTAARAAGGLQNPAKVEGSAKLTIDINGLPSPNYRARTSMDGMFKDVKLSAGKTQMLPDSGVDI